MVDDNSSSFLGGGGLVMMAEQLSSSPAVSMSSSDLELVDKMGVRSRGTGSF